MTKTELEELVSQQQEIIDGLYEEIEREKTKRAGLMDTIRDMQSQQAKPWPFVPTSPTTPIAQTTHSNSPWPNFTIRTN